MGELGRMFAAILPVGRSPRRRSPLMAAAVLAMTAAAPVAAQRPAAAGDALAESAVEQRPQAIAGSCLAPTYPVQMRAAHIEGRVVLQFVVDTTGHVDPVSIVELQSTHQLFATAARRALLTCRYRPGRFGGRVVRVRIETPYNFRITGS